MANAATSSARLQECIVECDSCHDLCVETVSYCLSMAGRHAEPAHVTLMLDCAEICQTAADFMLRASPLYSAVCAVCADVCEACARSCAALDGAEMAACADACRRCAAVCRAMA